MIRGLLRSRFLRDSGALQLGSLCLSALGLLGVLGLSHVLGARGQGEYYLATATFALLWLVSGLGMNAVVIRRVAAAMGEGRRELAAAWLGQLGRVTLALGLVALAAAHLLLPATAEAWFGAGVERPRRIAELAALLALGPLLELPRTVAVAGLAAVRRMGAVARLEGAQEACRVVLVVALALATGDVRGAVLGQLAASLLGGLLGLEAWLREARAGHLPGPRAVLAGARHLRPTAGLGEGLQVGLVRNINVATGTVLPALILGRFGSPAWVAYLRIAQRLADVARLLAQGISRTALPALAQLGERPDPRRLGRLYGRASLLSGLVVGLSLGAALLLVPWVLPPLLPPDFPGPVTTCLWILAPGVLAMGFSSLSDSFFLVTGQLRVVLALSVVGLFVNAGMMVGLAAWSPTLGVPAGLTWTYGWSLLYVAYAAWWLRREARSLTGR